MIQSKLNKLLQIKNILQKELCENVGITPNGLRHALNQNDFKISTLQKISDYLSVPITYWFESDGNNNFFLENTGNIFSNNTVKEKSVHYGNNNVQIENLLKENERLKQKCSYLEQQLHDKNEIIKLLNTLRSKEK
jgi:transcriptional regulator with XRE-family HTH domain